MNLKSLSSRFEEMIAKSKTANHKAMSVAHEVAGNTPTPNLVNTVINTPNGAKIAVRPVRGARVRNKDVIDHQKLLASKLNASKNKMIEDIIK